MKWLKGFFMFWHKDWSFMFLFWFNVVTSGRSLLLYFFFKCRLINILQVVRAKKKDTHTGIVYALKIMDKKFITKENKTDYVKLEWIVADQPDHPGIVWLFFMFLDTFLFCESTCSCVRCFGFKIPYSLNPIFFPVVWSCSVKFGRYGTRIVWRWRAFRSNYMGKVVREVRMILPFSAML